MDLLLRIRKVLHPLANRLGLRPLGRIVFRPLMRWRYGADGLASVYHNGRTWKLHTEVALRSENAEFETVEWLRSVVLPGDIVFDIGANVGQMTLEAAELVGPGGKVVAIEPATGNLKLLRAHVAANEFADRVEVIPAACGTDHGGTLTFHVFGTDANTVGSGHSLVGRALGGQATIAVTVPVVSVDGLCRERGWSPNVLKIDVEGAELMVLRGAVETLRNCRPKLRFGFHPFAFDDPAAATREIRGHLDACGYDGPAPAGDGSYLLDEYVPSSRS